HARAAGARTALAARLQRALRARVARAPGARGGPRSAAPAPAAPARAPLLTPSGHAEGPVAESAGPRPGEVDPLVGNGLGSPLCRDLRATGELASANRRDCETSGF